MLSLQPIDPDDPDDREWLVGLLARTPAPFHAGRMPTADEARSRVVSGAWGGRNDPSDDHRTYAVMIDGARRGVVRLDDLAEDAPLFDLRLEPAARGHGHAATVLACLADVVFRTWGGVDRLEGQTREDNIPMRRAMIRAGWTKEAHYRRGWPVPDGEPVASIAYALLRSEWETGVRVPLEWDDLDTSERS